MSNLVTVSMPEFVSAPVEVDAKNRAEDVRNQLRALKRADEQSFLAKGAYMQEVRDQKHYKYFGYRNLEEFCLKELEYGARQVRNFVEVYEKYVQQLSIDENRLLEVGSTKLAVAARVVNEKNVNDVLSYAKDHSVRDVYNQVAIELGNDGLDKDEEKHQVSSPWQIWLTPAQKEFVNDTVELAKLSNGSDWQGAALEGICADWRAGLHEDAGCTVLTFVVTPGEQHIIGVGIEKAKEMGFATVGAMIAAAVGKLFEAPNET